MRFKSDDQIKYMTLIREINFLDSLIAQRNFFAENNPFQAIVGGGQAVQDLMERRASCSDRIREFYLSHGLPSRRPNVKEMASTVGLSTIYSYIYFAASNFVHFNPYALLRLGWGPKGEPCQFSVAHFGGYYRDLSAFCGALLYLAFARSFRSLLDMAADHQVACDKLEQILLAAPRWPELITFEELNLEHQHQESIFRRALLGKTAGENGHYVFVGILNEIKSLP
ncbi:DUF5677 domain-containing protein [Acetobacter fallax]|uniref:TenA family transcriptional regulator n=1 Tax=Acetobacter fallax TaxID=1737473 RepID=A0ABX0KEL1_9PROT|nr:DUF5677 domain-containing protein [Acetobacter fallax]NHO34475.1 hypothetical protein [Acetobacter fallax]NHO38034.1 hypothetical protein [Acetobacter fallax]